jgi:pimeloyl-ACP methyl ester carboxylesterase
MDPWRRDVLEAICARLGIPGDARQPAEVWIGTSDGVQLRALDWGGGGPAALLLHGGALTAQTWDYACVGLRADYRLIALDMRGHGESGWSSDYSPRRFGQDASEVVDALGLGPMHVVGHSLGGLAAAEFALSRPDLARSLTMVDVAPGAVFEATARMRKFMGDISSAPSVEAVVEAALRISPLSDPDRLAYRMRAMLRQCPDGSWSWKRDGRRAIDYGQILERMQGLSGRVGDFPRPFLMVRGGRSRPMPRKTALAFTALFPDPRFVEATGAGHNVQEDNPQALIVALRGFWTEITRTAVRPDLVGADV